MKTKTKRIFAGVLAGLMALMVIVPSISMLVHADNGDDDIEERGKISDLGDRYKELEAKKKQVEAELQNTQAQKQEKVAVKEQLGEQIGLTTAQISVLSERIALLEEEIAQKELEQEEKQKELDESYELFKLRFRAMATTPQTSTLDFVLGAKSFSQMVTHSEVLTRVAQYDKAVMEDIARQKQELADIEAQIEKNKEDIENDKNEMDAQKQSLDQQLNETQSQIQDIAAMEQKFVQNKEALQKEMKQVQAEIDAIYAELTKRQSKAPYVGGVMSWPAQSAFQVTSLYGSRFGGADFHTGVDISGSGVLGTPVLAANSGTVALVQTSFTPNRGYGMYLIIDHGGGISTLYAHCSAIYVSEGQTVSRGDKIAAIGSTGNSTGPHVHFEVRVNGKHTNPVSYLQG